MKYKIKQYLCRHKEIETINQDYMGHILMYFDEKCTKCGLVTNSWCTGSYMYEPKTTIVENIKSLLKRFRRKSKTDNDDLPF